jgi:multidrug transporter EmrE-like cation transporter
MDNLGYLFLFLAGVFISAVSQILLKQSANKVHSTRLREYLNFRVLFAYVLFFVAALISILAYTRIALSLGAVLESAGYIFVLGMGVSILKEKLSGTKIAGMILIMTGILLVSVFR